MIAPMEAAPRPKPTRARLGKRTKADSDQEPSNRKRGSVRPVNQKPGNVRPVTRKPGDVKPGNQKKEQRMEEQGKVHEATKRVQETVKRSGEAAREGTRVAGQVAGMGTEVMAAYADANQRMMRELMELWVGAARESARLYGEFLQASFVMARETQAAWLRYQVMWPAALRDPFGWYQRALEEGMEGTRKALRTMGGSAEAVGQSAERLQSSAEKASRGIQEAFGDAATRVKEAGSQAA
jgi:hypothetical protein